MKSRYSAAGDGVFHMYQLEPFGQLCRSDVYFY